jgi:heptosyltransferase-2
VNVAVRLPNWLGDTVMAVPTLRALRAGLGESDRVTAAGPWASLLAEQGLAEYCVTYPRSWRGRLRTADTVARLRPDVVFVLPGSLEAALSAWYWGAARRIGYDTDGRGLLLTHRVPLPERRLHQVDEYLALLEPLGLSVVTRDPVLRVPQHEERERRVEELLASVELRGGPIAGIHVGAAFGPSKLWSPDRVAGLCAALTRRDVRSVLLGTAGDRDALVRVRQCSTEPIASLVGRDNPELLPTLLARLAVLVSGDSGPAHLAAALGTPVVVLFGPTDPARSAPRGRVTTIAKAVPCAPCFYPRCPIDHICMRAIGVDEVADAVEALIRPGSAVHR